HFKVPKINIHLGINHILRHAIKQLVRRNRLDDAAFVLRSVVAECCSTIKFADQRNTSARRCDSDCAQDKRAPTNSGSKLVVLLRDFLRCQKLKAKNEGSLEQKNAQREAYECDQARDVDRQANIACAQDRPERDSTCNNRQQNKDRYRPYRGHARRIASSEQSENHSANRAHYELAGDCRSNANVLQMIVPAYLAHEGKERTRGNKN